jgi:hypothetical protein
LDLFYCNTKKRIITRVFFERALQVDIDVNSSPPLRNVTIGELSEGKVVRVTDYWGEPFTPPEWRRGLSESEDVRPHADELTEE